SLEPQGNCQVRLADAYGANAQDVFAPIDELKAQQPIFVEPFGKGDRIKLSGRIDVAHALMASPNPVPKMNLFYNLFDRVMPVRIPPPRDVAQTEVAQRVMSVYKGQIPPEQA